MFTWLISPEQTGFGRELIIPMICILRIFPDVILVSRNKVKELKQYFQLIQEDEMMSEKSQGK